MSPRAILLTLATLFAVAGLSFGLTTVHSGSTSCGAVFKSGGDAVSKDFKQNIENQVGASLEGDPQPADSTSRADACHSALGDRKPLTYGALGIAALALIAGIAASGTAPTNADGSKKPSIWR